MNTRHTSHWFWAAPAIVCLTALFFTNNAASQPQGGAASANVKTAGGLTVVTFTVNPGTITVNLPDDMRAGDTISGTVVAEPKGQTPEERAKNKAALGDYVFAIRPVDVTMEEPLRDVIINLSKTLDETSESARATVTFTGPETVKLNLFLMPNESSPIGPCGRSGPIVAINEGCSPISQLIFTQPTLPPLVTQEIAPPKPTLRLETLADGVMKATERTEKTIVMHPSTLPKISDTKKVPNIIRTPAGPLFITDPIYVFPNLGQTGRPIVINGPFDGDSTNTGVTFQPVLPVNPNALPSTPGTSFPVIAESPRQCVVESPTNITGPLQVTVNEGGKQTTSPFRNVGVNLSAPKTNLLKGEKTTLTVQVTGLEGIKEPVPLTLECKGVITMEGGIYQPLVIQPSQVGADGRYSTTRGITGVQAGGWRATATVVTQRFNVCLQDDTAPGRRVLWNSFTGDYIFTNPFPLPKPPGQPPQTGSTTPPSLTGTGKVVMKPCIITLTHNAPDRRVMSRLDTCNTTGDASVQTTSPKTNFTITDRNITDNTCGSK